MNSSSIPDVGGRRLRDLGAFVSLATGRPLLPLFHNRITVDSEPPWTMADIRKYARGPLTEGYDFSFASMVRMASWFFVAMIMLVLYVAMAFVRRWTDTWEHPLPVGFMTVTVALCMSASGMGMASGARWSLAWWQVDQLDRHLNLPPETGLVPLSAPAEHLNGPRPTWLVRLCTPSNWDVLPGLFWSCFYTPLLYDRITEPPFL